MRTYKKKGKEIATREFEYLDNKVCDLCGKEDRGGSLHSDADWGDTDYDFDIVHIRRAHGTSDRDGGGYKERDYFDICPDCFVDKVVKWLQEQGATMQSHETFS